MARSKLITALRAEKGRIGLPEKQRLLRKKAEKAKRKRLQAQQNTEVAENGEDESESETEAPELVDTSKIETSDSRKEGKDEKVAAESSDEEDEEEEEEKEEDSEAENEDEDEDEEEEEDEDDDASIALSDISDDDPDIIPHQTLTINNTAALQSALARIAIPKSQPYSTTLALTVDTPKLPNNIHDDLARELAFYTQALEVANKGRALLKKEGVPFSRPADYFAEMVKSDEHMGLVKGRLLEIAANKKAAADARKLRDAKKFGKKVQQEKLAERQKAKKDMLEKVESLKRKRGQSPSLNPNEPDFDVVLEEAVNGGDRPRHNAKRARRDAKYGHGGKKRHIKSNDAKSTNDMSGFSAKAMKHRGFVGKSTKGGKKRPGKSKRMAKK